MSTIAERRANAVLALIDASTAFTQAIDSVPSYTGALEGRDYYRDEKAAYDAAVAEYGAAHAPTADEIKAHLLEHLDTGVRVWFSGRRVEVEVGLEWTENGEVTERFGFGQDDDHDNQCIGECC